MAFSKEDELLSSKESIISDTDIFNRIRRPNRNRRRMFHKVLITLAISSMFILTLSILVNKKGLIYANFIINQVNKLAELRQRMLEYRATPNSMRRAASVTKKGSRSTLHQT